MKKITILLFLALVALPAFSQQNTDETDLAAKEKELANIRQKVEKHRRETYSKLTEGITAATDATSQALTAGIKIKLVYTEPDTDYKPTNFVWHASGPHGFDQILTGQSTVLTVKETGQYQVTCLAQDGSGDGRNQRLHMLQFKVNALVEWEPRAQ